MTSGAHGNHVADRVGPLGHDAVHFGVHPAVATQGTRRFPNHLVGGVIKRLMTGIGLSPPDLIVRLAQSFRVRGSLAALPHTGLYQGLTINLVAGTAALAFGTTARSEFCIAVDTAPWLLALREPATTALLGVIVRLDSPTLRTNTGVVLRGHARTVMKSGVYIN